MERSVSLCSRALFLSLSRSLSLSTHLCLPPSLSLCLSVSSSFSSSLSSVRSLPFSHSLLRSLSFALTFSSAFWRRLELDAILGHPSDSHTRRRITHRYMRHDALTHALWLAGWRRTASWRTPSCANSSLETFLRCVFVFFSLCFFVCVRENERASCANYGMHLSKVWVWVYVSEREKEIVFVCVRVSEKRERESEKHER